ncbi:hypothetical protein J1605_001815 [Eschrichtius robustus]|uniref:Retinol dehydrogenase 10 n=1 Tax=Eschrichtius robustus TaxID=9764 RepID=A0AB34I0P7_ESCRO|nr:hypothetical protein J1605_001815 [Eschrichtius robustus]
MGLLLCRHSHEVNVTRGFYSWDYCASKFGVVGFHESLSHELKAAEKDGIKTTLVCPYLVDTGMFRGCRIRKEIEPFLPPLKPDYCVKQAMKAILTDQPMICTPRLMYIVTFMKRKATGAQSCEVKSTNQAAVRILSHREPGERSGGKLLQLSSDRPVSQPGGETGKEDRIWEGEELCEAEQLIAHEI